MHIYTHICTPHEYVQQVAHLPYICAFVWYLIVIQLVIYQCGAQHVYDLKCTCSLLLMDTHCH